MKNFNKKLAIVMGLLFMASGYAAEGALGDARTDKKAGLALEDYRPNQCVIAYAPKYCPQVSRILIYNKLQHPLDTPGLETLVFKEGAAVKGVCIFGVTDGYVYRLAVGKQYQRQGVGKALLHRAMHLLHEYYGVEEMSLNYETDQAREYYANLGWQVDERSSSCRLKLT